MRRVYLVAAFTLAVLATACPPTPPPAPPPDLRGADMAGSDASKRAIPACPIGVAPVTAGVCAGFFTVEGLICVRCPDAVGCHDTTHEVYCAATACVNDPRCRRR